MKANKPVPFVPNSDDDLHCQQAAYMMIAKYFDTSFSIEWEEWSKITGYEEGMGTWASESLLWFFNNGYKVKHISLFDYPRFIKEDADYLRDEFGKEVGDWQVNHSNLPLETRRAKKLLENDLVEEREPQLEDIRSYLNKGFLVRVLVNSRQLNNKPGYFGHAVVVSEITDSHVTLQDPGLPPLPNRKVPIDQFYKAWADPNDKAKEMDAITR